MTYCGASVPPGGRRINSVTASRASGGGHNTRASIALAAADPAGAARAQASSAHAGSPAARAACAAPAGAARTGCHIGADGQHHCLGTITHPRVSMSGRGGPTAVRGGCN